MKISQIYSIANTFTQEYVGDTALVNSDVSNIVDLGRTTIDSQSLDKFVNKLVDHIGKMQFDNRTYNGIAPSVLMEAWEFGAVKERVFMTDLPAAVENQSWELQNNTRYPYDTFYKPEVGVTFWDKRTTFEIDLSTPRMQVKSALDSASQFSSFISMLYNWVDTSFTAKLDKLILNLIGTMIAHTVQADFPDSTDYGSNSTARCINLLKLYNDKFNQSLSAQNAITSPEFIRFAAFQIGLQLDRMKILNNLFNISGRYKFTTPENLHLILLSDFVKAADIYLQSDTFHDMYTKLPNAQTVPFWQGNGQDYSFNNISSIKLTVKSQPKSNASGTQSIEFSGILGVAFDKYALGVSNLDRWVNSTFNPKADFYTNFWKISSGYFGDPGEQFVLWYVADETPAENDLTEEQGA